MLGPLSQQKSAKRLTGVVAGAKLISRQWFLADGSTTVPNGAKWISARCEGAGGGGQGVFTNLGSGGAFSREDRVCAAGQAISVTVGLGVQGAAGGNSSVSLAGNTICLAEGGKANQTPGLAANGIGTVRSSGGASSSGVNGVPASPGTNGGSGGPSPTGSAGGAAGERNVADALILGGNGAGNANNGSSGQGGIGQFPGGGSTGVFDANSNGISTAGANGVVVIEFWSAKP